MRTRLKDVAERLQLSTALVSGVLNQRPNVWASEETRIRIFEVARELNYQPSAAAQALSKGRTDTVCLVYRRLEGREYRLAYTGLVDALSEDLQNRGFDLNVANFGTQEAVMEHLQKLASSRACDAIILWGREVDTEPQGELLEQLGIPFLVKGRHEDRHPNWNQIDFDHEGMMEQAVRHLATLGHRKLAYLGFPWDEGFVRCLNRGYVNAHRKYLGADANPALITEHEDEVEPNERTIERWLLLPEDERPTAFVIGAGNSAWHALETCLAQTGIRLGFGPEDYAAAGVGSLFFRLIFGDAVAYQGIEVDQLAHLACPALIESLASGTNPNPIRRFMPSLTDAPTLQLLRHGVLMASRRETSQR